MPVWRVNVNQKGGKSDAGFGTWGGPWVTPKVEGAGTLEVLGSNLGFSLEGVRPVVAGVSISPAEPAAKSSWGVILACAGKQTISSFDSL